MLFSAADTQDKLHAITWHTKFLADSSLQITLLDQNYLFIPVLMYL